ncbi:NfeD family protein [Alcaligenes sp. SDU_A2]|uniref:NfeD family protein n=1 Tax=Alcaligenes sp. SDU_A2 TaxID=3136634 RepID=UPI002D168FFF|nr:NfeD family protein [Alcaligenes sp.]HRL28311.1 NfeD family protein [Alcaligenes sp.]
MGFVFDSFWHWLVAGVLLMAAEIVVSGVYLLWLGLGALTVGLFVAAWPTAPAGLQWLVLAGAMLGWVVVGVRWQVRSRVRGPDVLNTGLAAHIGAHAVVSEIFVGGRGRIRLNDSYYSASAAQDLQVGQSVVVRSVQGTDLFVERQG